MGEVFDELPFVDLPFIVFVAFHRQFCVWDTAEEWVLSKCMHIPRSICLHIAGTYIIYTIYVSPAIYTVYEICVYTVYIEIIYTYYCIYICSIYDMDISVFLGILCPKLI